MSCSSPSTDLDKIWVTSRVLESRWVSAVIWLVLWGLEAIIILRLYGYTGAIFVLTANAMYGSKLQCQQTGSDGLLIKPIDREQFYQIIAVYKVFVPLLLNLCD